MKKSFCVFLYGLLLSSAIMLFYLVLSSPVLSTPLEPVWGLWIIGMSWCSALNGLGLTGPVACIALTFGWVQLYLIIQGEIQPHLANKGFWEAFSTLLKSL